MVGARKLKLGPTAARLSRRLAELRDLRRLSLVQLADQLPSVGHPIRSTGLSKIEQGERRVDVDDLVALAIALNVTPNALLLPPSARTTLAGGGVWITPNMHFTELQAWRWANGEDSLFRFKPGEKEPYFRNVKPYWRPTPVNSSGVLVDLEIPANTTDAERDEIFRSFAQIVKTLGWKVTVRIKAEVVRTSWNAAPGGREGATPARGPH